VNPKIAWLIIRNLPAMILLVRDVARAVHDNYDKSQHKSVISAVRETIVSVIEEICRP
jgi:hypothetical protein